MSSQPVPRINISTEPPRAPQGARGRVAFVVLGCAKNQVEAESMSSQLARMGWDMTADVPNASVVIVHTCGFLEAARQEALDTVARLRRAAPRSFLVMSGCFSQYLAGKKPAGVDAVLGTGEFGLLPDLIARGARAAAKMAAPSGHHDAFMPRPLRRGQLSSYLRISEGCNHRCSFCIIPQLRGNLKSRPPEEILAEGRALIDRGVGELTLISQDTSDYGGDLSPRATLAGLLKKFLSWDDLPWLRLLYVYPSEVGDGLIDLLASDERLCRYLDMPLQHISDRILKSMKRDWGRAPTLRLLEKLRKRIPGLALRTTFISGYPGETEKDFREMVELVEQGWFEHVGVFPYSPEGRSPSSNLEGHVPLAEAEARAAAVLEAQAKVLETRSNDWIGKEITVLVENGADGSPLARGMHQAPEVDGQVRLARWPEEVGFYKVRVTGRDGVDLLGQIRPERGTRKKSAIRNRQSAIA